MRYSLLSIFILVVLLIAFFSFVLVPRGIFSFFPNPFLNGLFYLFSHPGEAVSFLEKRKESLRDEHLLLSLKEEVESLREALRYGTEKGLKLRAVSVIGFNTDPTLRAFLINQGERDGVVRGMVVVDELGFLLGSVDRVFGETSFVKQIQSPDMEFLVRIEGVDGGGSFIARGATNHVQGIKIPKGMYGSQLVVVTSGRDGKFPPGVLVGRTKDFILSKDQVSMETTIETSNIIKKNVYLIIP